MAYQPYDDWLQDNPPPDLQGLAELALAEARAAGSDLPEQWVSAYSLITPEMWVEYDLEYAHWENRRAMRA